jgi:hypothetical protein
MVLLDPKAVQRTGASCRKLSSALGVNERGVESLHGWSCS